MNFLNFVINRRVLVSMLFLGLSLLGLISYNQLSLEMMPEVDSPYLIVRINSSADMNPEYFEKQAVIPVEGVIGTVEGISEIESTIQMRRGSSATIYAYFNSDVNIDYTFIKLQERLNEISYSIPEEFNVSLTKVDTDRLSNMFMRLQVRGGGGLERVRSIIDNDIVDRLESIDGVSNVEVTGGQVEAVEITLDPDAAEAYNLTPSRIRNLIARSSRAKTFVGHAYTRNKHYFVNLSSEFDDVQKLKDIVVNTRGPVFLRDIATITFGAQEPTTISRVNGKDAVIVQLIRDASTNLIDLSHSSHEMIDLLNAELKHKDIEIVVQTDTAEEMEANINLIMKLAIFGGLFAVVILWFFMRNLRLVITILLSIPVSILVAFNFFYAFDITLNSLTLVGMVLAIGMLLDNSVVVLENIYRHLSLKRDLRTSVINGTKEVWRSVTAATLTTVTVFLPFLFSTDPLVRLMGRNIGVSIISTLLVSLSIALILLPMITFSLMSRSSKKQIVLQKVEY
ncbi:efflux RND transporter permease subunit, partial [candidate division KSB1 bacterium]